MQLIVMKEDRGTHFRGDIVEVRASSTPFGGLEPQKFVMVEIPDLPLADYERYSRAWVRTIDFSVVASDPAQDGFRLRLYAESGVKTEAQITRAEVEAFIEAWGGAVHSVATNEVVFDITVYAALTSPAFWEVPQIKDVLGSLGITEVSYDEGSGVHRIRLDYSAIGNSPTYVEQWVRGLGLTIVSHQDRVLVYDADRTVVRVAFQNDLKEKAEKQLRRRRYYFTDAVVSAIENAGGTMSADAATVAGYLKDKAVD